MSKLDNRELDRLCSELAGFTRSGVPIPEGLAQLEGSLSPGKFRELVNQLATSTEQGVPLSEALKASDVDVDPSFTALVRCGEIGGDMTGVLDFALSHGRRLKHHRSSLSTILIYPILVVIVMLCIMAFTSIFIVPRFIDIYHQLNAELPTLTQTIVNLSQLMSSGIGLLIIVLAFGACIYLLISATTENLPTRLIGFLPGVRNLVYLSDTAAMAGFIGHLLRRGVPLPEACNAASLIVYHDDMRHSLQKMAVKAEQGGESGDELDTEIPATAAWLYRKGEQHGTLPESCEGIARYCEHRFDLVSRRTLYMMEPLLILIVAVLCGLLVVSFYLPLFNIPRIIGK